MTAYLFLIALSFPALTSVEGQQPETLSLLERPLYPPPLPTAERARLEAEIAQGRQTIAREPGNLDAALGVARAQNALGHPRDAIETLTRAMEGRADEPRLRLERGRGFVTIRKFDLAERDFRKAAETLPAANCDAGFARYLLGDFARATEAFTKCPEPGFYGFLAARRSGSAHGTAPSPPPDRSERAADIRFPGSVASKPARTERPMSEIYLAAVEDLADGRTDAAKQLLKPLVEKNERSWMEPAYIAAEADYWRLVKNDPKHKKKHKKG